jgi:hypothetical protein
MDSGELSGCWSILSQETLWETGAGGCASRYDDPAPRGESLVHDNRTGIYFSSRPRLSERDDVSPVHNVAEQDFRYVVLESIDTLESRSGDHEPRPDEENLLPPGLINGIDLVENQHSRNVSAANACQNSIDYVNTLVQVPHAGIDNVQEEVRIMSFLESRTKRIHQ